VGYIGSYPNPGQQHLHALDCERCYATPYMSNQEEWVDMTLFDFTKHNSYT